MASTQLEKPYECFNCKLQVRLQRDEANNRWNKFNLDGSDHKCQKSFKKSTQLTEILDKIGGLERQMATLAEEVFALRDEIQRSNATK